MNKKNVLIGLATLTTTVVVIALSIIIISANKSEKEYKAEIAKYQSYYTEYQIEAGDNLWNLYDEICEQYPDTKVITREDWIESVHDINSLKGSKIISSYHLVIPYLNGLREVSE